MQDPLVVGEVQEGILRTDATHEIQSTFAPGDTQPSQEEWQAFDFIKFQNEKKKLLEQIWSP